jgi:hypothetical protein
MRSCLSLPLYPELTEEQIHYTARVLKELVGVVYA